MVFIHRVLQNSSVKKSREKMLLFIEQGECNCCAKHDCEDMCSKSGFNQYTCRSCSDGVKNGEKQILIVVGTPILVVKNVLVQRLVG